MLCTAIIKMLQAQFLSLAVSRVTDLLTTAH